MTSKALYSVLIVLSLISLSHQLKCFSCYEGGAEVKSFAAPNITIPSVNFTIPADLCNTFSETLQVECPSYSNVGCYRIQADLDTDGVSGSIVAHGCLDKAAESFCNVLGKSASVDVTCSVCSEDGCNSGSSTAVSFFLLASSYLAYKFLM